MSIYLIHQYNALWIMTFIDTCFSTGVCMDLIHWYIWCVHAFRHNSVVRCPQVPRYPVFPCCVSWMYDLQVIRDKRTGKTKGLLEKKVEWKLWMFGRSDILSFSHPLVGWDFLDMILKKPLLWYDSYPSLSCLERSHEDKLFHSLAQEDSSLDLKLLDEEG